MLREPQRFGKYLLLDRISVGGMAEVFKAKAFGVEGFEKILAIKRILPDMVEDSDFIEMFIDEAKISGQLNHANICQIFELGRYEKAHYIAMEYISGKDLLQINNFFQRGKRAVPFNVACFIIARLCEGLDYAHRKTDTAGNALSIIHRDVSPQNVLVSFEGEVKLIDFGIAKARYRSSKTAAGVLKGKFGYMSPEQVRGLRLDRRSDIFSLGTLLYEMVTGGRLFGGETDFAVLEKVRNVDIVPPSRLNPDIDPEFEEIILTALARTPEGRYQWANELQEQLQRVMLRYKPLMTTKRLSAWMKEHFAGDIQREQAEHERFLAMGSSYASARAPSPPAAASPPPPPPPPPAGASRDLPDFDEYDDDEETALMKERQGGAGAEGGAAEPESDFQDIETLAQTPGARAAAGGVPMAEIEDLDAGDEQEGDEATVILWGQDEGEDEGGGEDATMLLPPDDGMGLPEDATMLLPPEDEDGPGDAATVLLPEEGDDASETMILPDDEEPPPGLSVDRIRADAAAAESGAAAGAGAPAPATAALPVDLPPPRRDDDPFGLELAPQPAAGPETPAASAVGSDTAQTPKPARRLAGWLGMVIVGLAAALLSGGLVALLRGGGEEAAPPPAPRQAAVTLLVQADADVKVTVDGERSHQTGKRGAVLFQGLSPGRHQVTFAAKGYEGREAKFDVEPGQVRLLGPYRLQPRAKPSTLVINVSDMFKDAEVTLDGELVPMAKLGKPIPLPQNKTVELRVGMLGYVDHVEQIQTGHDKQIETETISLAADSQGQVSIKSAPSGARIWINGAKKECVTPCRVGKLDPDKRFRLRLEHEGYKVHKQTYRFDRDERTKTIIVTLNQQAALLLREPRAPGHDTALAVRAR
jgi:serine/threonine protein kinase